jgi:hypothetical protein
MSNVTVDIRVDLVLDHGVEELDETDVAARIAAGDTTSLRDARALDGRLRIGDAEILDELVPLVQVLCFNAVIALITDGVVFDYSYLSSNESAQLRTDRDTVVLSGSDLPETKFRRRDLLRSLRMWRALDRNAGPAGPRSGGEPPATVRESYQCSRFRGRRRVAHVSPRSTASLLKKFAEWCMSRWPCELEYFGRKVARGSRLWRTTIRAATFRHAGAAANCRDRRIPGESRQPRRSGATRFESRQVDEIPGQ